MKSMQNLDDVAEAFLSYAPHSMKGVASLGRMRELLQLFGNPQDQLRVIHIAGTSGKTSTSYFIRGMLEAAGKRTGLTVSPHIVGINERVQVGGVPLCEEAFLRYANDFLSRVAETEQQPSYFELIIGLAFYVFAAEKVDYAVVETGVGGLLDATNIVESPDKVCVVTDVGLDHTALLGGNMAAIARHKAGIIRLGNQVYMYKQSSEVMGVVREVVQAKGATLQTIDAVDAPSTLPLFQQRNWSLARAVAGYVAQRDGFMLPAKMVVQAPPGRFEIFHIRGKTIILDGAHNPQKMQALVQSLQARGISQVAILVNLLEAPGAKNADTVRALEPVATSLIIPQFEANGRSSLATDSMEELARVVGICQVEKCPSVERGVADLLKKPQEILLVTGSLYLVSLVRAIIYRTFALFRHPLL